MARSAAQKIIDVTIFIASCYIGGLSSVGKLITKFGKVKAITVVTNLAIKVGLTKTIASRIAQCIGIITGWSIGGGVAYLLDRYDKDGVSGKIRF